jgi:hypothetical protein
MAVTEYVDGNSSHKIEIFLAVCPVYLRATAFSQNDGIPVVSIHQVSG